MKGWRGWEGGGGEGGGGRWGSCSGRSGWKKGEEVLEGGVGNSSGHGIAEEGAGWGWMGGGCVWGWVHGWCDGGLVKAWWSEEKSRKSVEHGSSQLHPAAAGVVGLESPWVEI